MSFSLNNLTNSKIYFQNFFTNKVAYLSLILLAGTFFGGGVTLFKKFIIFSFQSSNLSTSLVYNRPGLLFNIKE